MSEALALRKAEHDVVRVGLQEAEAVALGERVPELGVRLPPEAVRETEGLKDSVVV